MFYLKKKKLKFSHYLIRPVLDKLLKIIKLQLSVLEFFVKLEERGERTFLEKFVSFFITLN